MEALTGNPTALWLFVAAGLFSVKHFLADFVLQNAWMSRGKNAETDWIAPLAAHTGIHALLTALIFMATVPSLAVLAALADWIVHAVIDRLKAILGRRISSDPVNAHFWWLFGADQLAHQLTHLALSVAIAISI